MEGFEVTDLDNDFDTTRPRRKLSKRQQMLRIWADDSREDDPSAEPSFETYNKDSKNRTVNFLPDGIQQASKSKEEG